MNYISTRGAELEAGFEQTLMTGLAPDGGLYVPVSWPTTRRVAHGANQSYQATAVSVMSPFMAGNVDDAALTSIVTDAYASFEHPEIAPLVEVGDNLFLLELFHGPTLAFKDFAMQILSRLMERALARTGGSTAILAATSGDTGAAAVEAFRGRKNIEIFILFPQGRISEVQRRQMTTAADDNVHILALDGTFDDAQTIVKSLLEDAEFRAKHALSAINSINWARIAAQCVYYFSARAKFGPETRVSFAVPTGNFGDIFAGYAASRMGLDIGRLVAATNENDILVRAIETGRYQPRAVHATDSPSMDIQVSSNFERLLFEATGRDGGWIKAAMARLRIEGDFDIPHTALTCIRDGIGAFRASREEAASAMAALYAETGYIADPHTAVGLAAAHKARQEAGSAAPTVVLATAHPAKFPSAVERIIGRPAERPARLERYFERPERFFTVPNDARAVAKYIAAVTAGKPASVPASFTPAAFAR